MSEEKPKQNKLECWCCGEIPFDDECFDGEFVECMECGAEGTVTAYVDGSWSFETNTHTWKILQRAQKAEAEVGRLKTDLRDTTAELESALQALGTVEYLKRVNQSKEVERLEKQLGYCDDSYGILEEKASQSAAEVERLRKGIISFLEGDYSHPGRHRPDKCPHGVNHWTECDECDSNYFSALLGEEGE